MSIRILVVDDERQITRVLRSSLESHGYEVAIAQDGVEALRVYGVFAPELVITDLSMPNMDGAELTRAVRAFTNTPIIVLSVRERDATKVLALDSGADDYMTKPFSFAIDSGAPQTVFVLISLLVCLVPTTIGGLLSAIGIAGMDRLVQHNVLATSGRAVEAAGDVNTLLLDKMETITIGNRQASEFIAAPGVSSDQLADAAQFSSLPDETQEGRSICCAGERAIWVARAHPVK